MERGQCGRVVLGRGGHEARDIADLTGAEPARERGHAAAAVRDLADDQVVARLRLVEVRAGLSVRLRGRERMASKGPKTLRPSDARTSSPPAHISAAPLLGASVEAAEVRAVPMPTGPSTTMSP